MTAITGSHKPMPALDRGLRWFAHQHWLRYGLRNRVLRAVRNPDRAAARDFEVPFAGYVYPGRMDRWIDWIVYYYGGYELDELELMRELLATREAAVALDIGANVGHHTTYLASFCAAVHAFEPYADVATSLREKIERNALTHVHLHPVGVGDADAVLAFFAPQGANNGTGSFVASHETRNNRPAGRLQVVHGDSYLERLALPAIDLIKIDVEGFELATLRGLRQTMRRYRPIVVLELSDAARFALSTSADLMALFPDGYRVEVLQSQRSLLGVLGRRGCALRSLHWHHRPLPGGYVNLLLRPRDPLGTTARQTEAK